MTRTEGLQVFDTRKVPQTLRAQTWQALASRFLVPLHIDSTAPTIEGQMHGYQCDAFKGCHVAASPHIGHRTSTQAAGAGNQYYKLAIATHGHVTIEQCDRRVVLAPGQMAIYDTSEPYAVGSKLPFGVYIALVPQDALGIQPHVVAPKIATKLSRDHTSQLVQHLQALNHHSPLDHWEKMASVLGEAIQAQKPSPRGSTPSRTRIIQAAQTLVADYLADTRLSPDFIAAKIGISRRQLYKICAEHLGPIAGYIRYQRLQYSSTLLNNTRKNPGQKNIADIALASGFDDPAHFSRAFKNHYGHSPSAYRQFLMCREFRSGRI